MSLRMKIINYLFIVIFCFIFSIPAVGQDVFQTQKPAEMSTEKKIDSKSESDKMTMIHQLIAQGAYISAAAMLETLYEQQPNDRNLINLLFVCYTELKAFSKAEMLIQRQLKNDPNDYLFQFRLLELYIKTGIDSTITGQIDNMLERFPGDQTIYQNIIQVLIRDGYPQIGIDIIKRGRREFGNNNLFLLQMAMLYETRQSYYDAIMEYAKAIGGDSAEAAEADKKTAALIRYPLAPPEAIRAFKDILDSLPNDLYALKYLSETYIRQGLYLEAFNAVVKIDSIGKKNGQELLGYIRKCRERKLYEQVLMATEYVERMYPKSNILMNYKIYSAEALGELGKPHEAIDIYRNIADSSLNRRDIFDALLDIGNIYRYKLKDYDSARVYYDSVSYKCPYGSMVYEAGLEKAKLFLTEGNLDQAAASFTALYHDRLQDDQVEYLDYNLAMIEFVKKNFESAEQKFRQMMYKYPRGLYLNDALMNSLIIGESFLEAPEILSEYADALLYQFRLMPDSMVSEFNAILDKGRSPLAGITNYKLAAYYESAGEDKTALELIDKMKEEDSDDYFFPYCLKIKGDILSHDQARVNEASEIYKLILTDFGDYPFIGEIRKRLQELEGYQAAG